MMLSTPTHRTPSGALAASARDIDRALASRILGKLELTDRRALGGAARFWRAAAADMPDAADLMVAATLTRRLESCAPPGTLAGILGELSRDPVAAAHLAGVKSLSLASRNLGDVDLDAIARACPALRALSLPGSRFSTLAPVRRLVDLRALDLRLVPAAEAPLDLGDLGHLTRLSLRHSALDDTHLAALAAACPALEALDLQDTPLSSPRPLGGLTQLRTLSWCVRRALAGTNALAGLAHLPQLTHLTVKRSALSEHDLDTLARACPALEVLDLEDNDIHCLGGPVTGLAKLSALTLRLNPVAIISHDLVRLQRLTLLNLNGLRAEALPDVFGDMPRLGTVCLLSRHLRHLPPSLAVSGSPRVLYVDPELARRHGIDLSAASVR